MKRKLQFCGWALAAGMLLLPSTSAWAQTGKVAKIEIRGTTRYSPDVIAAAAGLNLGDTVGREDLQAAADRLAQLGPFHGVRYSFSSKGEEVAVEFQVEEAPAFPVSFDNFPWFTDDEILESLRAALPLFDGKAPDDGTMLPAMDALLERMLKERGVAARVEHALIGSPGDEGMIQQFRVVGPALKIERVEFGHALAAENRRVQEMLHTLVGKPFSRFAMQMFLQEHVRPAYLSRGHLRVEFGRPRARFTGDPNKPLGDSVLAIVPIEPGPVYSWGGAAWAGNTVFPTATLEEWLALPAGETADGLKIAAALDRVRNEYGRRGHLDLKLEAEPQFDDASPVVRYRIRLEEGRQYRMGRLVITGLSVPAERRLTAAWKISPGQVFDRVYFDEFLATGIRQAFADTVVHYDTVGHWLRTNAENRTVDVLLDFR